MMAISVVASPAFGSSLSLYIFLMGIFAAGFLFAPQPIRRSKRVVVGALFAVMLAVGAAAYAEDVIIMRPPACEGATIWDADYWIWMCWNWPS